jgi:hypothetical protein
MVLVVWRTWYGQVVLATWEKWERVDQLIREDLRIKTRKMCERVGIGVNALKMTLGIPGTGNFVSGGFHEC